MLNYNDKEITSIIADTLDTADVRRRVTLKCEEDLKKLSQDAIWAQNDFMQVNLLLAYTELLADKFKQALDAVDGLHRTNFNRRLWLQAMAPSPDHTTVVFFLASEEGNQELFTLVDPLSTDGHLVASNLPTLNQIAGNDDDQLAYTDDELHAMIILIKEMYAAGYGFRTVDETVLQPVEDLTFTTKFDMSAPAQSSRRVEEAGNLVLHTDINGTVAGYHVLDEAGHDWLDLGTTKFEAGTFIWESTSIPEELVGQTLTLEVTARTADNVPAMDELFVIASANAILMRKLPGDGLYALSLPNHNDLTVRVDPNANTVALSYPDTTTQIIELNAEYPFFGEWLMAVLPKKPAFN